MSDFYRILGVSEQAGADEITRAYRQLARQYHPDASGRGAGAAFRSIRQAYETLSDDARRRRYDAGRSPRISGPPAPDRWLDDEVAIDFPSVGAMFDRVRQSFFGAEPRTRPLAAELTLSPREAARGVRVPFDVPLRWTCDRCGGRGEIWLEPCGGCAGRGDVTTVHRVEVSVPARVRTGARVRFSVSPPYAPPTSIDLRVVVR